MKNNGNLGVSVIIPCYNLADYVSLAIKSVINQDYSPVEIIVVDDGSTDTTREVIEGFRGLIHYIVQSNSGVSFARNKGVDEAVHPLIFGSLSHLRTILLKKEVTSS